MSYFIFQFEFPSGGPGVTESSPRTPEKVFITFPQNPYSTCKTDYVLDPGDSAKLESPQDQKRIDGKQFNNGQQLKNDKSGMRTKINRLEVRAALDMSVNVLPFWLCTFPVSCYAMALYWCVRLEGECDAVFLTWTYMWDLFLLHSIYNPVAYMSTSTEFRRALLHIARKFINVFHIEIREN
jgi:5-hydroxytryptamine receptor 1